MARMVNSFALLDDEEGEDMNVLVENVAKKVEVIVADPVAVVDRKPPPQKQSNNQQGNGKGAAAPSDFVRSTRGRGGRGRGAGRGGYGGNDSEHFGNEQDKGNRRYWDESKGNGYDDANRGRGRGRGGRGRGRGRGFNNEHVIRDEKENSGDNKVNADDSADGWEQVPQTHSRGYGNHVSNKDEERSFRNENRSYGGERRGYGGGNHGFRGRRDGMNYGNRVEEPNKDEVKENVDGADSNDVVAAPEDTVAEGDVAIVTEEPKDVGAEEVKEESVKVENPAKKQEEEDENLMTLEEYEKLYAEKRKALEAQKIEVRKVTADKDFEAMQMLEKKKEEILLKPETAKLKKKESIEKDDKSRKTLSINEFLKPADGETFSYRRPGRGGRGRGAGRGDNGGGRGGESGDFRNGERGGRGGSFRGGRGGDFKSGDRAAFKNSNGYSRHDGPTIHIEDQSQFPVLKGAAVAPPAVEAA